MERHRQLGEAKTLVFKVGSGLLAASDSAVDVSYIGRLCDLLYGLISEGRSVVLVSSGAVVAGMSKLEWRKRPRELGSIQVAAAVGQMSLANIYAESFARHGIRSAQVLLTAEDMSNRTLYLNARTLLKRMCSLGIVPVVNENDAIALEGLRFGDNDRLAAMISNLLEAELLVLLTDQDGLLDASGTVVSEASALDSSLRNLCRPSMSGHGSGGMQSKLDAAAIAARGGTHTVILNGASLEVIGQLLGGESVGTLLYSPEARINARKLWLVLGSTVSGHVEIDDGATQAIMSNGKSLLPIGVRSVGGEFNRGDVIGCRTLSGEAVAQGVSNFSSKEIRLILGKPSGQLRDILGYDVETELIHRDNMAILSSDGF